MNPQLKKSILIGVGIFAFLLLTIGVVYFLRKPAPPTTVARPSPTTTAQVPMESPQVAEIFAVEQLHACTKTFTVSCASNPPSAPPSDSPSIPPSIPPSVPPSTPPEAALQCVYKKMYEDDPRNQSGFYYLEREITNTNTVQNGQIVVFNIMTKNSGGNSAPDTTITDKLSANLTYLDGDTGCTYDDSTRVVTCIIGTLSQSSEAQRSFRASVSVAGTTSVANTAEVFSSNGQRDSCSVQIDATGNVVVQESPAPTALPVAGVFEVTVGTVGVGLILLLLGALGLLLI